MQFTRGWTLQELLAPQNVEFYAMDWKMIGTKHSLVSAVYATTGIHEGYIWLPDRVGQANIARIFSWASTRQTTREEDMAYCLLGLLDVNMPLIYGEGKRAFIRLQMQVIKQTSDQSFLCWKNPGGKFGVYGPFCDSPKAFNHSGNILVWDDPGILLCHHLTNKGLSIRLPFLPNKSSSGEGLALMNCSFSGAQIAIPLVQSKHSQFTYYRLDAGWQIVTREQSSAAVSKRLYIEGRSTPRFPSVEGQARMLTSPWPRL